MVVAGAAARGPRSSIERYLAAVERELELRADALDERFGTARPPLDSLYLGGGTPSLLPPDAIARLIEVVRRRFGLDRGAEVTLEANPGPDERGDAAALRAAGVTRLSFGAQSMDDAELRSLGRRHRARDVGDAVAAARVAGIGSVSLDLLYDVPGQSQESWARTLEAALALEPEHLSAYALTLDDPAAEGLTGPSGDHLPPSEGARRWRDRARSGQDDERAAEMYELAVARLGTAGYRGYEISNWALPGHESRHNLAYWRRLPFEAVGPGAHAFDGAVRRWNAAPLAGYLAALAPVPPAAPTAPAALPAVPPGGEDRVSDATAAAEATILALRLDTGVPQAEAASGLLGPHLAWALGAGLLGPIAGDRLALTTRGRLLSNELFARLV